MKKFMLLLFLGFAINLQAQKGKKDDPLKNEEYIFEVKKEIPHMPIENQASSGTCWSFSGIALLEAENMRLGGKEIGFSPMFVVRNIYFEKVVKYVRMHGKINLSPGGSFHDVIFAAEKYGLVPGVAYRGLEYGSDTHDHSELDRVIEGFGNSIIAGKKVTEAYSNALNGILDAYFGKLPERFIFEGKEFTPKSFAKSTNLNFEDYVSITSFTHHPFYESFILEIPDNWIYGSSYNLPMNEMIEVIDNALENGYTVGWASDVSEKGFSRDIATVPVVEEEKEIVGSDQEKWTGKKKEENKLPEPLPLEQDITQEMRQKSFDNYETTDDHGLLIIGWAVNQKGDRFYKVKNSWNKKGKYEGYLFASVPFVKYKTTNILVHKNAIPKNIREKLKL